MCGEKMEEIICSCNADYTGLYDRLDSVIACLQVSNSLTLFCLAVVAGVIVCYVLWRLIKNFL